MRYEFVTLFDVNYLPRGLVLYSSLQRTETDFRLRVLCLDERTEEVLNLLSLPRLEIVPLRELEAAHPELPAVKPLRSPTEYAWTLTPASCLYSLEREPAIEEITYLDADLMFFADPGPVFDELGSDSVLITPHRYAPAWNHLEALSGRYNVQFMTFRRDDRGLAALRWWHERCVEWCYQRHEDGKFGDQKYLDDWPERFSGVHVLGHPGAGLAPWNVSSHQLSRVNGSLCVDGDTAVFFHYHGLRLRENARRRLRWSSDYPLSADERRLLWEPYIGELRRALATVRSLAPGERAGVAPFSGREAVRRGLRAVMPRPLRVLARRALEVVPHRHTWSSASVARQHLALVLRQLESPQNVPPLRTFMEAIDSLVRDFELPRPARLLDFGCGAGHYSELLARTQPDRFDYTGCDGSPEMIAIALDQWPGRKFLVNELFVNTIDLDAFDVVVASALVDVLENWESALDILLGNRASLVLLHRQRVTEGQSHVRRVPGYRGQRTFASFVALGDLERVCARNGRRIARTFSVEGEVHSFILPLVSAG